MVDCFKDLYTSVRPRNFESILQECPPCCFRRNEYEPYNGDYDGSAESYFPVGVLESSETGWLKWPILLALLGGN